MDSGGVIALIQETTKAAGDVRGVMSYSISIGDLMQIAATIITVMAAYTRQIERLKGIETKLDVLWDDYRRRSRHARE